jgi:hypothetical protein
MADANNDKGPNPLVLYLYSNANLWGCVAGLIGAGLMFARIIGPGWLAIVAGLYAVGALLAPRPRRLALSINFEDWSLGAVTARLDAMLNAISSAVDPLTVEALQSIKAHVLEMLPRLQANAMGDEDRHTLRETVARYLPETLQNYLRLPPMYRRRVAIRDGKTAEQLLFEQLKVIDGQMIQISERVLRAEAQDLLVQGRFLEDKFRKPDLLGPSS